MSELDGLAPPAADRFAQDLESSGFTVSRRTTTGSVNLSPVYFCRVWGVREGLRLDVEWIAGCGDAVRTGRWRVRSAVAAVQRDDDADVARFAAPDGLARRLGETREPAHLVALRGLTDTRRLVTLDPEEVRAWVLSQSPH